jgi:hypothetical protein
VSTDKKATAPKAEKEVSFEQNVWDVLSKIDAADHIDHLPKTAKRPAVAYLPWHKAWMLVCRAFPATQMLYQDDIIQPDGTVEVEVEVKIQSTRNGDARFVMSRLAVMNNYFGAIPKPDARDINDARQRCLVKALAFAGLALNLWDGSIIPVGKLDEPITVDQHEALMVLIEKTDTDLPKFLEWCEVDDLLKMPYERYNSAIVLLESKVRRMSRSGK